MISAELTPLTAILAGRGPAKAAANGWHPPYPSVPADAAERLDIAARRSDALAGMAFAGLDIAERAELVTLVTLLHSAHVQATG